MAVKKVEKSDKVKTDVVVETPDVKEDEVVTETSENTEQEDKQDDKQPSVDEEPVIGVITEDEPTDNTPVVEVVVEESKTSTDDVVVDEESAKVNPSKKPNGNVKIRMRVDHKCTIAMERYDLKAGKTYTVPANVKRILNNAGLLAPL